MERKPTNPKDALGTNKIPLHLWPETATVLGSLALMDGALKYGRANWRATGVRASVYYDAARRHLNAWFEGTDIDPDSGLPHLAGALASLAVMVDAQYAGVLEDDRNFPGGYHTIMEQLTKDVERIRELRKGEQPQHYTIKSTEPQCRDEDNPDLQWSGYQWMKQAATHTAQEDDGEPA